MCPCVQSGYTQRKNIAQMTARKYGDGMSQRILVAKETLKNQDRQKLPIIILNLDGIVGYFDEMKTFYLRQNALNQLIALSANFRILAFCIGQTKRCVRKLCQMLAERD